jgi:hypothetical protein
MLQAANVYLLQRAHTSKPTNQVESSMLSVCTEKDHTDFDGQADAVEVICEFQLDRRQCVDNGFGLGVQRV